MICHFRTTLWLAALSPLAWVQMIGALLDVGGRRNRRRAWKREEPQSRSGRVWTAGSSSAGGAAGGMKRREWRVLTSSGRTSNARSGKKDTRRNGEWSGANNRCAGTGRSMRKAEHGEVENRRWRCLNARWVFLKRWRFSGGDRISKFYAGNRRWYGKELKSIMNSYWNGRAGKHVRWRYQAQSGKGTGHLVTVNGVRLGRKGVTAGTVECLSHTVRG